MEMLAYDGPVIFDCLVEKHENCFPMIPSGKPHNEMLLSADADAFRSGRGAGVNPGGWATNVPARGILLKLQKGQSACRH
jgi:hypothetical protein